MEDEYENVKIEMKVYEDEDENDQKKEKKKTKRSLVKSEVDVTIAKDAKKLVEMVAEARDLELDNLKCRVVIDGGQGSLKVVASIFPADMNSMMQESGPEKLTGANRLIILAEVEGLPETHSNIRQLLERLQLHLIPGLVLVGDLSVTNLYTGISKHGGKYACYQCEGSCTTVSGVLRTFRSLSERHAGYVAAGSKPKQMQNFKNVINECLVKADPDELVCNVLPLPELHLLLGFVTHLHKLLYRVWPHILIWGRGK